MNVLVDDIGKVVQAMRNGGSFDLYSDDTFVGDGSPYYIFGHYQEIANRLLEKDADTDFKFKKYPLIVLRMDFTEDVNQGMWRSALNVIIVNLTNPGYNAEQRYASVFKPLLYPLYEKFLKALRDSGLFSWDQKLEMSYPPHTKIDRPYWGTPGPQANLANIFNDPLDAVEILNLKLNQRLKCSA